MEFCVCTNACTSRDTIYKLASACFYFHESLIRAGAGEKARRLRVLTVFLEDLHLIPSTYMEVHYHL